MKRSVKRIIPVIFLSIILIMGCNNSKSPDMVTVPFNVDALGTYKYAGPDTFPNPKCTGDLSAWRAIVEATGTGEPMGDLTINFDFCGDTLGNYGNIDAYMIAENGDTLFIDGSGQVIQGRLSDHQEFVISYWRDTLEITGGTGIYKGAKGTAVTDDYNSSEDSNSHHYWTGTITMMEEKKK